MTLLSHRRKMTAIEIKSTRGTWDPLRDFNLFAFGPTAISRRILGIDRRVRRGKSRRFHDDVDPPSQLDDRNPTDISGILSSEIRHPFSTSIRETFCRDRYVRRKTLSTADCRGTFNLVGIKEVATLSEASDEPMTQLSSVVKPMTKITRLFLFFSWEA